MLKRLELVGFKSFADKTAFEFGDGVTAIVGPNGSGKCVVGTSLVTLADGRDVPIQELVEMALQKSKECEPLDDGILTRENPNSIEILSLNPQTLQLEQRPVAAFVKREAPAQLLRIRTRSGREVTATPYHPLFTLERGSLHALKAEDLRVGTRIALPRRLPVRSEKVPLGALTALKAFQDDDKLYVPYSPVLRSWADTVRPQFGTWMNWARKANVSELQLKGFLDKHAIKVASLVRLASVAEAAPPFDGYLKSSNTSVRFRLPTEFTPEFARFLGLLVAEGRSTNSNQIWFVNSDAAVNTEFARLAGTLFDVEVHRKQYKSCVEDILIYSGSLGVLLERLFRFPVGSKSNTKEVPPQLFQTAPETQWAFLSGLFEGDAHLCAKREPRSNRLQAYLEYSTASPTLARQVIALLLRLGVFASLRSSSKCATNTVARVHRTYYSVFVYGSEQLRYLAQHLSFAGQKTAALQAWRELPCSANPNLDLVPGVTPLVKEAAKAAGVKIKANRRVSPKLAAYVEQRCEASRGGLNEVIALIRKAGTTPEQAEAHLDQLAILANSDVYWDEIVSIDHVEPVDDWVYDLSIAETHNFIADNIIVHNSNIVDAVRWILGEQSAKSLRGGEMADVIFNGSSSRRSLGLAEVTLTFDNAKRQLAADAEEVQVTRRVYRNGEGEYLINGQACRLKDIKDMFLGSGLGNDDLCIIAQGKVDVLLQASNKDRRTIFEEAAGISRFKAKKLETLRRLERVDQNLARVKDIIEEVEKQLRSVKLQASKAQRYQEHTNRLKELRIALGLLEYGEHTSKFDAQTQALEQLKSELDQRAARAGACEAEAERLEMVLADLDDHLHEAEATLARHMQQVKTEETTITHESSLTSDLETELKQTRKRLTELTVRVRTLAEHSQTAEASVQEVTAQADRHREEVQRFEAALQSIVARLAELQQQITAEKAQHFDQMRRSALLQNEAVSSKAQVDNLRRERDRLRQRSELAASSLASIDVELQELLQAETRLQERLNNARQELSQSRQDHERFRQLRDRAQERISELRQERSGLASRIEVLEGLIRSHEGLGTGVREVIELIEQPGAWSTVIGMIADFLTVKREYAPLIDLALGDWAQRFVVRDMRQLAQALAARAQPFSGRVSFLPRISLSEKDETEHDEALRLLRKNRLVQVSLLSRIKEPDEGEPTPEHPGLVAPAEQLVSCDHPELQDLPAQLLGRTLIVRDLATARTLAEHATGFRLVTLQGELLEPDGTLTVGAHHAETGILSRKSELRELRDHLSQLDLRISETELDWQGLRDKVRSTEFLIQEQQQAADVLGEQVVDLRSRVQRHQDRRQGLHEEVTISRDEIHRVEQEVQTLEEAWRQNQSQAAEAEARVQELYAWLHQADQENHQCENERQQAQQAFTEAQITLAQITERLRGLQTQHQQGLRDYQQRRQELLQNQQNVAQLQSRLQESQQTMLNSSSVLAHAYLHKEEEQRKIATLLEQRDRKRQERARLSQQGQSARTEWRKHQESVHQRELDAADLRHQRDTLAQRLREDYQVELAELFGQQQVPLELDIHAAQEEIEELRRKLSRLGSVNMEALAELQELESRVTSLQTQWNDLTAAKKSLEEIIFKINGDSQRLFMETFAVVKTHFQELFRKLFGGGMADIVMEDENDVLESGIDIIARPPGKELRSISLLSGGEKTLSAVALLLAVFRTKPSPFCLLDEVDAALDEANVGRFTAVLREFSYLSQFIVVTHSKKTMAAADVLYGITMQESGISKQVTIRFEDWVDEDAPAEPQAKAS